MVKSSNDEHRHSIAVVGAGPSGLIAAEWLASRGFDVDIFDAKPTPARKFLMAGRGGLNLTYVEGAKPLDEAYGPAWQHLRPLIEAFSPQDLIAWSHGLGEETFVGSSKRVFPRSLKASPILRAWIARLNDLGVKFHTRQTWTGWSTNDDAATPPSNKQNLTFTNNLDQVVNHSCNAVILALGGASWPRLGSNGSWVEILQRHGIQISPLTPFNAGVRVAWSKHFIERSAGEPLKRIALKIGNTQSYGEAVITDTGLEGGAIYDLNRAILETCKSDNSPELIIDLRPGLSIEELTKRLEKPRSGQSTSTYLRKNAQLSKTAIALLHECHGKSLPTDPHELATRTKSVPVKIDGLANIDRAISTSGGVKEHQLDANAMLKEIPGVFIAGEMRDWDAPTGGYLLQATFATGVQAAKGVNEWIKSAHAHSNR